MNAAALTLTAAGIITLSIGFYFFYSGVVILVRGRRYTKEEKELAWKGIWLSPLVLLIAAGFFQLAAWANIWAR